MREPRSSVPGTTIVAVTAAVALVAALGPLVRLEGLRPRALLGVEPLPREGLGLSWFGDALWPADLQLAALDRAAVLLLALLLAAAAIAVLNAVVLLAESSAARRDELSVRAAVGASPGGLVALLLAELTRPLVVAAVAGLLLGLGAGTVARRAWPGVPGAVSLAGQAEAIGVLLAIVLGGLLTAHAGTGWRVGRSAALASGLRAGERLTDEPRAIFLRRALAGVQIAVGGGVLISAGMLGGAVGAAGPLEDAPDAFVVRGTASEPGSWPRLLARLEDVPGLEAESLATPGTLVGLGIRDLALAQCGVCVRGTLAVDLLPATVDYHAVAPGFFELAGLEVVAGRAFTDADRAGAQPVALVNRTFASSSFEGGRPIGKQVRAGRGHRDWFTIVGVVDDRRWPVLGSEETPRQVVYLSALQQPPRSADVLLRGTTEAVEAAWSAMLELGFAPGPARPLGAVRADAGAPLAWLRVVAIALAGLALVMTAYGVHATALQVGVRRIPELAVRRALGARPRDVALHVLGERLRLTAWGIAGMAFVGAWGVALLKRAAGGVDTPGLSAYLSVAALLLLVVLAASARAAARALEVEPAEAMR